MQRSDYMEFFDKRLGDIGTRYVHYSELIDMWEGRVRSLQSRLWKGKDEESKQANLEYQIATLRTDMATMSDYIDEGYRQIRTSIDMLNDVKPEHIKGGRGTPIRAWKPADHEEIT